MSCRQTYSAAGDDALGCRILFCSHRFGRREVGKSEQAQNRIMIFPGLLGDNYSTVREKHFGPAATIHREIQDAGRSWTYGNRNLLFEASH